MRNCVCSGRSKTTSSQTTSPPPRAPSSCLPSYQPACRCVHHPCRIQPNPKAFMAVWSQMYRTPVPSLLYAHLQGVLDVSLCLRSQPWIRHFCEFVGVQSMFLCYACCYAMHQAEKVDHISSHVKGRSTIAVTMLCRQRSGHACHRAPYTVVMYGDNEINCFQDSCPCHF